MAKVSKQFVCSSCGSMHPKWQGKCPDCGSWNTLEEMVHSTDAHRGTAQSQSPMTTSAQPLSQIVKDDANKPPMMRIPTGIGELDRVLGGRDHDGKALPGGLVPGCAILLGGDPGIGKSTLLLQAADKLNRAKQTVLYVTSEESSQQLRLRAERLGVDSKKADHLLILADTNLARIAEQIRKTQPAVVIIDSVQMIYKSDLAAAPGSITQLRTCCLELVYLAKAQGCCVILVGHVTKEGKLAGPRLLEHMVDTVLYFEGDRYHSHRIIRGIKNRFGTTLEVGLFEMCEEGLVEVADGAGLLAAEYKPQAGSVVCPVLQGSRCLMVEFQALTATGFLGSAKRKSSGLDSSRLAMLIAVLEKRGGLRLADQDIFTSVVGGLKVAEPAADLAIAMSIAGAFTNRQVGISDGNVCMIGEVGLGGEIRHVQHIEQRLSEAEKLGFSHIIGPKAAKKSARSGRYVAVERIEAALEFLN
ncbi:MAG TPA: DNA repair protein RadA [Phycisphaerales bacterium]|nr:DNA repair protein RadA [Phycisphaerales bacterium]HCD32904.1 DNA repair protein RadA [Phycisphaerales bacterium]